MTKAILKNRELSWLSFNDRVLQEARDPAVPLLERLKFLAIFSSNLDEFYRVRVATLRRITDLQGRSKRQQLSNQSLLRRIQNRVLHQQDLFLQVYQDIIAALEQENIFLVSETQLSETQAKFVREYFRSEVLSNLVPIMLEANNPFPDLRDHALYFVVRMSHAEAERPTHYALMEIPRPDLVSRFLLLPGQKEGQHIILLDDVIRFCLPEIFSIFEFKQFEAYTIKVTRDAELTIDNDVAESFIEKMTKTLKQRKRGRTVRFIYDRQMPDDVLKLCMKRLNLTSSESLTPGGRYHNFKDFLNFPKVGLKSLVYREHRPVLHPLCPENRNMLDCMRQYDLLFYYPFHSFDNMLRLLREAAIDPAVKSIKITVYRLARNSKVINALVNAIKNGKQVTVVVELLARFDEEANIHFAKLLEEEGAKVIYGVAGLKVHCKLCLIGRQEEGRLKYYAHLGTGNFNEASAKTFCDYSLMTADRYLTQEVIKVFQYLENPTQGLQTKLLLCSPFNMRSELIRLIDNEVALAQNGKAGHIILKVNNLVDEAIIAKLYAAAQAGVNIGLIVRSTCALVPGIRGFSDRIAAISIVDKYLEHARVFVFGNGGDEQIYIASADLMTRNLDHRVEVACPIFDPFLKEKIKTMLDLQLKDNVKARIINRSQNNRYRRDTAGVPAARAQDAMYKYLQHIHEHRSLSSAESIV